MADGDPGPRFCHQCGAALPDTAAFCSACGAAVTATPELAPAGSAGGTPIGAGGGIFGNSAPRSVAAPVYAGFWRRFWAVFIDSIVLNIATLPITMFLSRPVMPDFVNDDVSPGQLADYIGASMRFAFIGAVAALAYYTGLESSSRQATLGKMILGIQVTDNDGRRISFARAAGRHLGKYVSAFTLFIGYMIQLITAKRQALHDLIAGTLVVRNPNP